MWGQPAGANLHHSVRLFPYLADTDMNYLSPRVTVVLLSHRVISGDQGKSPCTSSTSLESLDSFDHFPGTLLGVNQEPPLATGERRIRWTVDASNDQF